MSESDSDQVVNWFKVLTYWRHPTVLTKFTCNKWSLCWNIYLLLSAKNNSWSNGGIMSHTKVFTICDHIFIDFSVVSSETYYILHLEHLQHISYAEAHQLLCIRLYYILMTLISSNKMLMRISKPYNSSQTLDSFVFMMYSSNIFF